MTPTQISRRTLLAGALVTTVAACARPAESQAPATAAGSSTIAGHGYAVTVAPLEMITAFGTQTLVHGTIASVGAPRRAMEKVADQPFEFVYVPVTLNTIKVFKGSDEVRRTTQLTLRIMGGTADGLTFDFDEAPKIEQLPVKSQLVVFGGQFQAVGESTPALTPNYVLVRDGDTFRDISLGQTDGAKIDAVTLLERIGSVYPS